MRRQTVVATFMAMYRRDVLNRKIGERNEKRKERKRNRDEN